MQLTVSAAENGRETLAAKATAVASPASLLIVRLSAMGDVIHAMPAVTALSRARPEVKIGWLVEERWAELLCARGCDPCGARSPRKPLVDWLHAANFASWRRALLSAATWRAMRSLRHEIRGLRYQSAIDLQGAIRSALATAVAGAHVRVGSASPREAPATMLYTRQTEPRGAHVVEQALAIVSAAVGEELPYADPVFPVDPAAESWAEATGAAFGGKPLVIVNPGAGWGAKRWPAASFGSVAGALAKRGMAVAVNHGPGEEALAAEVREASGGSAVAVKCSVGELIALTRRARLFVGGDTGPMHLAAALRVPVVALFGPTLPERNGPYATRSVVLRSSESVYNSSHTDQPDAALLAIQPQAVIDAAGQLLEEMGG